MCDITADALPVQLVFGPAEDGGYYLLGVTTLPDRLFDGIQWSTGSVLQSNLDNAQRLGLRVAPLSTLPMLADIDTVVDLERWVEAHGESRQQQDGPRCQEQQEEQSEQRRMQQPCDVVHRPQGEECTESTEHSQQPGSCAVLDAALLALAAWRHQPL